MWQALVKLVEKWACCHEWELYSETKTYEGSRCLKTEHTLICQKCGKIKKIRI